MFNKRIFLDYAATTPVDKEVFSNMKKYFSDNFANCQSIHSEGVRNKEVLKSCRERVARMVQVKDKEIIFTAGGTESNNLAIIGFANRIKKEFVQRGEKNKPHIITTNIEHVAVLESFEYLLKNGFDVTYLDVDKDGLINSQQVLKALKQETVLISIMLANNEIGTIMPIRDISRQIQKYKKENNLDNNNYPYLHTDASQAPNYLDINVNRLGVDMLSLDGSKIYGPKGIGCLVKKDYIDIESISFGGGQEMGLRSGTENLPLIVGFTEALDKALQIREQESERLSKIQKYFIEELESKFPKAIVNGDKKKRLPNNINVCFDNLDSEFAVIQLDEIGIACSAMTACRNLSETANSYVVEALGQKCGKSSLRFSMGRDTKKSHIDKVIKALSKIVK